MRPLLILLSLLAPKLALAQLYCELDTLPIMDTAPVSVTLSHAGPIDATTLPTTFTITVTVDEPEDDPYTVFGASSLGAVQMQGDDIQITIDSLPADAAGKLSYPVVVQAVVFGCFQPIFASLTFNITIAEIDEEEDEDADDVPWVPDICKYIMPDPQGDGFGPCSAWPFLATMAALWEHDPSPWTHAFDALVQLRLIAEAQPPSRLRTTALQELDLASRGPIRSRFEHTRALFERSIGAEPRGARR